MSPMGAAGRRWPERCAAAGTAAMLLAGCGGGGAGPAVAALDRAQVTSVLPDIAALPGWDRVRDPTAGAMDRASRRNFCATAGNKGCAGSLFLGSVSFTRRDENASARFWMVAYKDEKAAEAAYDVLWKDTARNAGKEKADLGPVGAQRDARTGPTGYDGTHTVTGQIRVGTALLWIASDAPTRSKLDKGLTKNLAALFSERAQQVQDGTEPTAALSGR